MSAHPITSGGICLSFSLDFKFMAVSKKNFEDTSILNVQFHVIHNRRHNIYLYLRSKFSVDRIPYLVKVKILVLVVTAYIRGDAVGYILVIMNSHG
jgi:hypothetical protein